MDYIISEMSISCMSIEKRISLSSSFVDCHDDLIDYVIRCVSPESIPCFAVEINAIQTLCTDVQEIPENSGEQKQEEQEEQVSDTIKPEEKTEVSFVCLIAWRCPVIEPESAQSPSGGSVDEEQAPTDDLQE